MPEPNIPLLRKTIEHIEAHPEEWDQTTWAVRTPCGTTMCFAGTALFVAGYTFNWSHRIEESSAATIRRSKTSGGKTWPIPWVAQEELGLNDCQVRNIFYCMTDDPAELREVVEETVGERL
jgi:hypothetical protein